MKPALLLIDVQKAFEDPYWGPRNNPGCDENIQLLLEYFRYKKFPVIHVQHMSTEPNSPLRPGTPGNAFKEYAEPLEGEPVFQKTVNSAFIGTNLESYLRQHGYETLVIAGITTNHCVSTSTRMAGNLGFKVYLASDGCHAFDFKGIDGKYLPAQLMHEVGLAELNGEFAQVMSTQEIFQLF